MQHFLRRLTGIMAIALAGVVLGSAQNASQPAASGQADGRQRPRRRRRIIRTSRNTRCTTPSPKRPTPTRSWRCLNTWKEKYPDSDFKVDRLSIFLTTYQQVQSASQDDRYGQRDSGHRPERHYGALLDYVPVAFAGQYQRGHTGHRGQGGQRLDRGGKTGHHKDEDWTEPKPDRMPLLIKRWAGSPWQQKNNACAESNLKKSLEANPNQR